MFSLSGSIRTRSAPSQEHWSTKKSLCEPTHVSNSQRGQGTTEASMPLSLHQSSLVLQNRQGLLQTCNLYRPPGCACAIGLRLCNASILDLCVVVQNCRQLRRSRLAIC